MILHLYPFSVYRIAVQITCAALFPQVCHLFSGGIDDPVRIVILQACAERIRIFILAELSQAVPVVLPFFRMLIQPDDMSVFIKDCREFPALHFEYDPEQTDSQPSALFHELAVIHPSVEPHPGTDFPKGFLFKVGQTYAAASHPGPDQYRTVIPFQVFPHLHIAQRKTRMKTMIMLVPSVKIDSPFHGSDLLL